MSSIQIKSNISLEDLIQGVAQLEGQDLDDFIKRILAIRAKRQVPEASLSKRESELLELIAQGPSTAQWDQFKKLKEKREKGILETAEQETLIKITSKFEAQNVERIKYLSELALLKNMDLRSLMIELGIAPSDG